MLLDQQAAWTRLGRLLEELFGGSRRSHLPSAGTHDGLQRVTHRGVIVDDGHDGRGEQLRGRRTAAGLGQVHVELLSRTCSCSSEVVDEARLLVEAPNPYQSVSG